jgi:hypothetical protein
MVSRISFFDPKKTELNTLVGNDDKNKVRGFDLLLVGAYLIEI